jgi:Na+/H+-dicarboxylate symporter
MHKQMSPPPYCDVTDLSENGFISTLSVNNSTEFRKSCECSGRCFLASLRRNALLLLLITALVLGIGLGIGLRSLDPPLDARQQMYFRFPGDLLMRMLKALVIPLIVSSLIAGVSGLGTSASGRIGAISICYYISTTLIAVLIGILLVCTIRPGYIAAAESGTGTAEPGNIADSFLDLLRNMFPDNIVEASFRQTKTYQIAVNETVCHGNDTTTCNDSYVRYDFEIRKEDGVNVLGLVVFSVSLGVVLGRLGEVGKPLSNVCISLAEATMCLVTAVIWYSPIGITFLIAAEIIQMEDPIAEIEALGMYIVTVLAGLFVHGFIVLPLIYLITVRKNPLPYVYGILQAMLTAFGTASSSATLPVTYKCLEEKNRIDRRITRFVLPVGATINMDGTALYEAVAAIYIAQSNGMSLNAAQVVTTSITATLASIGAASVPQAGLVTMVIVLSAIGLPADEATKILAVDWLLDRCRTAINVEGDSIGAGIVAHFCRRQLDNEDNNKIAHEISVDQSTQL